MARETTGPASPNRQDAQDHQFGAAAARDEAWVDELDDEGVDEDELPERVGETPRAGGKAEPDSR